MMTLGVVDNSGTCNLHPTASCAREYSQLTPLPILTRCLHLAFYPLAA